MSGYTLTELKNVLNPLEISGAETKENKITRLSVDSRGILAGEQTLFFAIRGDKRDGHDFIADAYQKQVRYFVVDRLEEKWNTMDHAVFIKVSDTLNALQSLAAWYRKQLTCPVLGITGSNGKTIVKEWLFYLLQDQYIISRSPKSYNSQIGVPLSVWLVDHQSQLAIIEAGISQPKEMDKLSGIIVPEYGIFTNITGAHQENFSSLEEKAGEKAQLFKNSKFVVYCNEQSVVKNALKKEYSSSGPHLFSWSFVDEKSELLIQKKELDHGTTFSVHTTFGKATVTIPFSDAASVENAAQCLAFLVALGLNPNDYIKHFKALPPVAMRLEIKHGINNCSLIDDSYNSDINSLEIALELLGREAKSSRSKKTLILSDIFQSGYSEEELYRKVAELIRLRKVDRLIGIGSSISAHASFFNCEKEFFITTDNFIGQFDEGQFRNETILLKGARAFNFDLISGLIQEKAHQTVMEVNMNAMVHNLNYFRSLLNPETKMVAMVKAFSYGSGAAEIASLLQFHRIDYLAVAIADEGVELRKAGIYVPILVMNPEVHSFGQMIEYQLEPNIYSLRQLNQFNEAVQRHADRLVPVHIKLETGMKRLGVDTEEELNAVIQVIKKSQNLFVRSVFTHLCVADEPDQDAFTQKQFERFEYLSNIVRNAFDYKIIRHILNSAGIERFPEKQFEMVRLGIGLYGISAVDQKKVQNVSSLKTTISQIRTVKKGETVGYGRKGMVDKLSKIAILPIGYADGFNRHLGNGVGHVYINGHLAPVIGNICMDMCMVNVTGISCKEGDRVEIFGEHIPLTDLSDEINTIPYEILTSVSRRVKRVYFQE